MREIIVGRQLELIEQRLQRLENMVSHGASPITGAAAQVEDLEARFEALRDSTQHQCDQIKLALGGEMDRRKHEVRRLAEQIQQTAQDKINPQTTAQDIAYSESRLVAWVSEWQKSLENNLAQRETWLIGQLRNELERIVPPSILSQPVHARNMQSQEQITSAAQTLAIAASALAQLSNAFSPKP